MTYPAEGQYRSRSIATDQNARSHIRPAFSR